MIDFMGKRHLAFILSAIIILSGVVFWFSKGGINGGFSLDIEFKGGNILQYRMNNSDYDIYSVQKIVEEETDRAVNVQKSQIIDFDDDDKKIDILNLNIAKTDTVMSTEEIGRINDKIIEEFDLDPQTAIFNQRIVDAFIGRDLGENALYAILLLSILIICYVAIRFSIISGIRAGFTAIIALLHDVAIMLSVYVFFDIPVNLLFIAAILTILGYSINDTIVIYDRIRENKNILRKVSNKELANVSINQSLRRSINTSFAVLLCLISIYILSSIYSIESLKNLSLPLIIGVVSGTYSSIFIASPIWVMLRGGFDDKNGKVKTAKA